MTPERHFIIGTAGHIDHGKTSLVKALTGINTDRLKDEQERGMTIDLGYAFLDVAGQRVGIVDVPGHEKFVKNMLAGATGIDLALFLVAADDGVMPQTVEHLEILDLLGVRRGIVVITKIDLVGEDLLALVQEETRGLLRGTALEGAEIVLVSSTTGQGIEELKRRIGEMVSTAQSDRPADLPFRMPVDRVFSQEGFGCVVTGSVMSGATSRGAALEIVPGRIEARVRGIQVHGAEADRATAGQRAALNLAGVKADQVARGHVLSEPGHTEATALLDASLRLLNTAKGALKHNARVRFHVGASETMARTSILAGNDLTPGASGFVQFRLEQPVAVQRGDRYVIRSYSPMRAIGGGQVLRTRTWPLKRNREGVLAALQRLNSGDPRQVVEQAIRDATPFTSTLAALPHVAELSSRQVQEAVASLLAEGVIVREGELLAHAAQLAEAGDAIARALQEFHSKNRLAVGMVPAQLMSHARVPMQKEGFAQVLARMKGSGRIKEIGGLVALADSQPRLTVEEQALARNLEAVLEASGFAPPSPRDAIARSGAAPQKGAPLLDMLVRTGRAVRLAEDLCFHARVMDQIREKVAAFLKSKGRMSVGEMKDLLGVSRKFAIPIAEHLDRIGLTKRDGDARVLAK